MRKVIIHGEPPADWVADAENITQQLKGAANEPARKKILTDNEGFWRDNRIRKWLLEQFKNKCWYTESEDSVSSIHVDHFRPKGRIRDDKVILPEGYWWLAFDWHNYRIAGQLINVKKSDYFPICEGHRATLGDAASLELECPTLIDPLTDETRLVSYRKDEDACIAIPTGGIDDQDRERAEKSIESYGLNRLDRLNQKRLKYWDACLGQIIDYNSSSGPSALKALSRAKAVKQLKSMISYAAEFSSVVEACIRSEAGESLSGRVFSNDPV